MHKINIRSFDLNLLSVFVVLWDTRSVTRASDRLALTQPAVVTHCGGCAMRSATISL